nr:MAG TPA: hypothetical protein [Bacteriophage sp.]
MKWLLDSNRRYIKRNIAKCNTHNEFARSIPAYFNKRIIATIRLSRLS